MSSLFYVVVGVYMLLFYRGGANVDALDAYEQTPLLVAARMGHLISFSSLKKLNADLSRTDFNRKSAVHLAAEFNHQNILKVVKLSFPVVR